MELKIPELSLVVLVGTSGSGKSTFAKQHFRPTEVISSDYCRGLVADNENDQAATKDAFEVLNVIVAKRLSLGRLSVIDATNTQSEARKPLVALARKYHLLPVAIVLDVSEGVCQQRNSTRSDRNFGPHVIRNQRQQLRRSLGSLKREGFRYVYVLKTADEIDGVSIRREPLWNNKKAESGPFDIIGDVHGCFDELVDLLGVMGYSIADSDNGATASHPQGRKVIFVGDLVDRGPKNPAVLKLVMNMVRAG